MAQEYNEILPGGSTNILQDNIDSRKNDEALRSGFSGSAFPTSPVPVAGQRCYREDLKKEYIFNGESWVEVASSGAIAQEVTLARGTHTKLQDRLGVSMNPDGTLKTPATANVDEFKVSGLTPTYISTNSFSVPGDMRAIFTENRRLKITQGAETIYTAVVSASYDDVSDKTTIVTDNITITNEIAAVDYSLVQYGLPANLDAGTLNGKSDTAFQEVAEKDQPGGYAGLDNNGALNSKIKSTSLLDFNTATIGGFYYWGSTTLNAPVLGIGGTALVIDRDYYSSITQIAIPWSLTHLYIRRSENTSNTEWSDWESITVKILGTVSQVGGVPTGAIIESGSNDNGWYVRFCDGTQICGTIIRQAPAGNTTVLSVWTFPAEFYILSGDDDPWSQISISATLGGTDDVATRLCKVGLLVSSLDPVTSTHCKVYHYNGYTSPISIAASLTAIGRWY